MLKFSKVSFEQYKESLVGCIPSELIPSDIILLDQYNRIKLPKRATKGSAGYDFYLPYSILLIPNEVVKVPTGIRVELDLDKVLQLYPRSGLGFKYGVRLCNTVGIIDSDYFHSDNEGHIMAKLVASLPYHNDAISLAAGSAFMQGVIMKYYTTVDDESTKDRNGGFGSTDE